MKKFVIVLLLIGGLAAAAYFTNPTKEDSLSALKTKLTEVIDQSMADRQDEVVTYSAWKLAGPQMVDGFVKNNVTVDNYGVCSLTRLHWDNKSYIVGVGGFKKTYITKRLNRELADRIIEQIEDKVNNGIPDILKSF